MLAAKPSRLASRAGLLFVVVALTCGLGGSIVGEDVVGVLGRALEHRETPLRLLGWSWGSLPFIGAAAAFVLRERLARRIRTTLTYVLVAWIASGALLIPSRNSTLQRRFGSATPDAESLSYGWAIGILPVIVTIAIAVLAIWVVKMTTAIPGKQALNRLGHTLAVIFCLLTVTGFVVALIV